MHDNAAAPTSADPARQPKLLERMRIHLLTRHYSIRTEEAYIDWARRFILFHDKRHPQDMGAMEVEAFLSIWRWTGSRIGAARSAGGGAAGADRQAGVAARAAAFVCHASAAIGLWHSHGAGIAGPCRCEYHHGLYACAQQGQARHFEPARCAVKHQRPVTGPLLFAGAAPWRRWFGAFYANSFTGTQLQNRLRSPYTLSTRPTGLQYFAPRRLATG